MLVAVEVLGLELQPPWTLVWPWAVGLSVGVGGVVAVGLGVGVCAKVAVAVVVDRVWLHPKPITPRDRTRPTINHRDIPRSRSVVRPSLAVLLTACQREVYYR